MTSEPGGSIPAVPAELVRRALRRVSARCYRADTGESDTRISLVMQVSPAGRRNAAEHIVAQLAEAGLALRCDDPVGDLTRPDTSLPVEFIRSPPPVPGR